MHLVGCLYCCISDARSYKHKKWRSQYPLFGILRTRLKTLAHFLNLLHIKLFMLQQAYSLCLKKKCSDWSQYPVTSLLPQKLPVVTRGVGVKPFFERCRHLWEKSHFIFTSGFIPRNVFCQNYSEGLGYFSAIKVYVRLLF